VELANVNTLVKIVRIIKKRRLACGARSTNETRQQKRRMMMRTLTRSSAGAQHLGRRVLALVQIKRTGSRGARYHGQHDRTDTLRVGLGEGASFAASVSKPK
jgi:hypothetical protein